MADEHEETATPEEAGGVPIPSPPGGGQTPGVLAAGAESKDGEIGRITQVANTVPGKPDGEVDTRAVRPAWEEPVPEWTEPWREKPS